jgi:hemolysin III
MTASAFDAHKDSSAPGRGPVTLALPHPVKPRLRGWLHLGMFPAVLIAGLVLTALADSARGRVACGIFALTACLLFGVSALYHRGDWSPRMDGVLRRLDHANIFLIIAGTYTPLAMLLLPGAKGEWLLWGIWAAAAAGILFRVFWVGAPRWLYTPCYIAMGWAAVFYLPDFMRTGGVTVMVLVIVGGVLYSSAGSSTASSAPTRPRAGSASTRSSTRSRWPPSPRTTSASPWSPTSTRDRGTGRAGGARGILTG